MNLRPSGYEPILGVSLTGGNARNACPDWVFASQRFSPLPAPSHPLARWTRDGGFQGPSASRTRSPPTRWELIASRWAPELPALVAESTTIHRRQTLTTGLGPDPMMRFATLTGIPAIAAASSKDTPAASLAFASSDGCGNGRTSFPGSTRRHPYALRCFIALVYIESSRSPRSWAR